MIACSFGVSHKHANSATALMSVGNPGVAEYYADFMQELYKRCHLPIRCISHAGHVTVPQQMSQCQ